MMQKNLCEIANELAGEKKDNLLPKHNSYNDLVEVFADAFTSKISKYAKYAGQPPSLHSTPSPMFLTIHEHFTFHSVTSQKSNS